MPLVEGTISLPEGSASRATVEITLVASSSGVQAGFVPSADVEIIGQLTPTVSSGTWSATLTANSLITPGGSVYKVLRRLPDVSRPYVDYISVPDTVGPHRFEDLIVDPPASLQSAALTLHEAGVDPHAASYGAPLAFAPYPAVGIPVLAPDGAGVMATFADVVYNPAGIAAERYVMYYTSDAAGSPALDIRRAVSADGLVWVKTGTVLAKGSAGAWDDRNVSVPTVWVEGGVWHMLYRGGANASPTVDNVGYATSVDGVTWTKNPANPVISAGTAGQWDDDGVETGPGGIIKVGATYYAYFESVVDTGDDSSRSVGVATSTDLVTWTKDPANPVLAGGRFCPSVFAHRDFYYLLCPHYEAGSDFTEIELWRDTAPTFYASSRQFVGVVKRVGLSGFDVKDQDTPVLLTTDVTRTARPSPEWWIYFDGEASTGGVRATGLLVGAPALDLAVREPAENFVRAGGADAPIFRVGKWTTAPHASRTTLPLTADRVYFTPLTLTRAITVSRMGIELVTAQAGTVVRLGVYADDGGYPGALLLDAGTVSTAGATGLVEKTGLTKILRPGRVWLAAAAQAVTSSGPTLRVILGPSYSIPTDSFAATAPYQQLYQTGVSGALPSTATVTLYGNGGVPVIGLMPSNVDR